jgi:hypothetical protein
MKKPESLLHRGAVNPHPVIGGSNSKNTISPHIEPKERLLQNSGDTVSLEARSISTRQNAPTAFGNRVTDGILCRGSTRERALSGRGYQKSHQFSVYPHLSLVSPHLQFLVSRNSEYNRECATCCAKNHKCGLGLPLVHLYLDESCLFGRRTG